MEKIVRNNEGIRLQTNLEILLYLGAGIIVAVFPLRFQYIALFPILTYGYLHNRKALLFFFFSLSLFLLALSVSTAYLTILGILIYFVLVSCVSIAHASMPRWVTVINLAIQLTYVIQLQDIEKIVLAMGLLSALYIEQLHSDAWMYNDLQQNDLWKGTMLVSLCLLLLYYLPQDADVITVIFSSLILFLCRPLNGSILILLMSMYVSHLPILVCFTVLFLRLAKPNSLAVLLYVCSNWMLHPDVLQCTIMIVFLLLQFLIWQRNVQTATLLPIQEQDEEIRRIKRRLQNFSGIFYSLGKFYEHLHQQESGLLFQMADGVEQMALLFNTKSARMDTHMLQEILEGYQFNVHSLQVEQQDVHIRIKGEIDQVSKQEIEGTLLPLLNTLYMSDFHIAYLQDSHLFYRSTSFLFDSSPKWRVEAYYDSISVNEKENGDTCSIFRHEMLTICALSDGMGCGEEAARSSVLISGILQRMIASDMEAVQAVKTINSLIHSDVFATLDIICMNAHTKKAYLVKSAACPTFLIRKGHLLQLDGHSLPVGIIEEIEPDCIELQLEPEDEILMISDGIHLQEVQYWMQTRKKGDVHDELKQLMQILNRRVRDDDSTALLLRLEPFLN